MDDFTGYRPTEGTPLNQPPPAGGSGFPPGPTASNTLTVQLHEFNRIVFANEKLQEENDELRNKLTGTMTCKCKPYDYSCANIKRLANDCTLMYRDLKSLSARIKEMETGNESK